MEIECLLTLCDKLNIPYYEQKGTKHIYPTEYIIYDTTRMITDNVGISDTIDAITDFLDIVYKDKDYGRYIDNIYKYYDNDKYKELLLINVLQTLLEVLQEKQTLLILMNNNQKIY